MNHLLRILFFIIPLTVVATACIEDSFSTSPSDQPVFSTDTLSLGTVFTDEPTPTAIFVVRNPHSKGMNISSISLSGSDADAFRFNVDGVAGDRFTDVEIRAKDSIFVLVEATLPEVRGAEQARFEALMNFVTNGVTSSVILEAQGQNVTRLRAETLTSDARFTALRPYQVFDSLIVAEGVTLTLEPGTRLLFHDGAYLRVRGTLISEGSVEQPVEMTGDRTGNVVGDVSFDIMSNQWKGVSFESTSKANKLTQTVIKNTNYGVIADGAEISFLNCRLRNSGGTVLTAYDAGIKAVGCEFAEAADGLVDLYGGTYVFNQCTFANYYLFSALSGAAIKLNIGDEEAGPLHLDVSNSIIYGNGADLSIYAAGAGQADSDLTDQDIYFRHCLFKSEGTDDDNFIECIWAEDPLYYTVREEYIFDYRLKPESPAIGAADPTLVLDEAVYDWYGNRRGETPDLGAYVFVEIEEE